MSVVCSAKSCMELLSCVFGCSMPLLLLHQVHSLQLTAGPPPPCLQVFLLLISFVAVPWMLVPKPLILKRRHEATERQV